MHYTTSHDFKVTNENDSKAMGGMLCRAKTILRHNNFTAIYDKGYHTGSEFDCANSLELMCWSFLAFLHTRLIWF
jgi:hypothetical protein